MTNHATDRNHYVGRYLQASIISTRNAVDWEPISSLSLRWTRRFLGHHGSRGNPAPFGFPTSFYDIFGWFRVSMMVLRFALPRPPWSASITRSGWGTGTTRPVASKPKPMPSISFAGLKLRCPPLLLNSIFYKRRLGVGSYEIRVLDFVTFGFVSLSIVVIHRVLDFVLFGFVSFSIWVLDCVSFWFCFNFP